MVFYNPLSILNNQVNGRFSYLHAISRHSARNIAQNSVSCPLNVVRLGGTVLDGLLLVLNSILVVLILKESFSQEAFVISHIPQYTRLHHLNFAHTPTHPHTSLHIPTHPYTPLHIPHTPSHTS